MFSLISKTVGKAYKASKKFIKKQSNSAIKETQVYKLINSLCKMKADVLPISKMSQLATMSFQMEEFQQIYIVIIEKLQAHIHSDTSSYRYIRNLLLLCGYLVKHGAGGFIDQFRQCIDLFQKFKTFQNEAISDSYDRSAARRQDIRDRATYIVTLLNDKQKLLRQKQLAMLVKQKMKISGNENISQNQGGTNSQQEKQNKINSFIENYIWKYVNKIDEKLDDVAELMADQVEKLLIGEIPQNFEIDELEDEDFKAKTEFDFSQKVAKEEENFSNKKINEGVIEVHDKNLLDL